MLSVELPTFREKDGTHSLRAELVIAKAFATAATVVSTTDLSCVRVEFGCPGAFCEIGDGPDRDHSQRALRDAFLLLVDRALTRVYPPIDVLQYLTDKSPQFSWDGAFCVAFSLASLPPYPSVFGFPPQACDFNGIVYMVEGIAAPFFDIQRNLGTEVDGSGHNASLAGPLAQRDSELWFHAKMSSAKARAGHDHQKSLDGYAESAQSGVSRCLDLEGGRHEEEAMAYIAERHVKFHRKASLWLTERIANEGNWARPPAFPPTTYVRGRKRDRPAPQGGGAASGPSHPSVLAAAAFALPLHRGASARRAGKDGEEGGGSSPAASAAAPSWMLHLDVRGIEFDAVLVAQTARYAYVGCPCWEPAPRAPASGLRGSPIRWVLVARLPIPSFLEDAAGKGEGGASSRGSGFWQVDEATRFDRSGPVRELSDACKRLVTVRAHVVRCRRLPETPPGTSPFTYKSTSLFLWFEDAYLLGSGPFPLHGASGEAKAETYAGLFGSDLIELVEASCRRYLRTCERMNRYVRANSAALKSKGTAKSLHADAMDSLDCSQVGGELSLTTDDAASRFRTQLRLGKERLAARADAVFSRITDTRSVYYKKLRGKLFNPVPLIRTSRDVEALFEGPTVEFKHHLSHYHSTAKEERGENASNEKKAHAIMDVERIRHTIAAMASTMGGVLCVGVTDQGEVVGHPRGEVVRELRTTGFCPAMVKDSVVVKELPVLKTTSTTNASSTGLPAPVKAMPKDWWKLASLPLFATGLGEIGAPRRAALAGKDEPNSTGGEERALPPDFGKVLTVITVSKGSAPFYTSGRAVLPYLRGCASTVRMPALIMARRLAGQFEGETTYDS